MRLKGGKLLLDLTGYDWLNADVISVDKEVINAILEKGVIVKLKINNTIITTSPYSVEYDSSSNIITSSLIKDVVESYVYIIHIDIALNEIYGEIL